MSESREREPPGSPPVAPSSAAGPPASELSAAGEEGRSEPNSAGEKDLRRATDPSPEARKARDRGDAASAHDESDRAPDSQDEDDRTEEDDEDDSEDEDEDESDDEAIEALGAPEPDEEDEIAASDRDSTPLLADDALWGSVARSVALGALLGFALASWAQLAFSGRAVNDLLADNKLPAGQRMMLLKAGVGAALIGAGVIAYFALAAFRAKQNPVRLERWLWFASPLLLAPGIASTLRYRPWLNEHERLLPIVLFLAIALEVLSFRALRAAPRGVRVWWSEMIEQLPALVRKRGPAILVIAGSLFYIGFFCFYLLRWHYKLRTGNFDLSINNNLMFGGLHGHFLESPVVFPDDPKKYLANHAKFGGYLFLPIYALYPRAETLLVLQSTLIGVSALPLFAFARRHISEWLACLVTLAYLAYYPMHGASFSEFQYVPIAGFFVLTTIWAAETRRWAIFGIIAVVGMTMREDIPIGMALVGAFLLVSGHRAIPGLLLCAFATLYFVVLRFYVMEEAGDWWFPNMYKELWSEGERGFRSVIKTLLTNPLFVLSKVLTEKKIFYLLHLLVPLAFLPARRWYLWAAFVPGALLTLLVTNYDPPITFSFHYVMHWTPYLFVAAVLALKSIGERPDFGPTRQHAAAIGFAAASLILTYNYGAFAQRPGSFKGGFQRIDFELSDAERVRHANLKTLIAMIPEQASVAATEKLGPHVSSRIKMYTMRKGPQDAEYALASSRELKLSRTKPKLLEALRSGQYGVVKRIADLALLKRGHDTSENDRLIRDWHLIESRKAAPTEDRASERREPEPEPKAPEEAEPEPRGSE
jgi:uncharacterized membrane protein